MSTNIASSSVEHRAFDKIFNDDSNFFRFFVFYFEVEPLKLMASISICSHIEMVFFIIGACDVLKITILEVRLESDFVMFFDIFFIKIIKDHVSIMSFHEFIGHGCN